MTSWIVDPQSAHTWRQAAATGLLAVWLLVGCGEDAATDDPPAPQTALEPAATRAPADAGHARMLALLRDIAERTPRDNIYLGTRRAREAREQLERLGGSASWQLHLEAGIAELQLGQARQAIELLAATRERLRTGSLSGGVEARVKIAFYLGVAYQRLGEDENCCARPTAESCILPIRGQALHQEPEGSTRAAETFVEVLGLTSSQDYWHLATKWLLNLAHMTLGTYPDGVPEEHRIPPTAFTAEVQFPRFANIAAKLGLDTFGNAGSVVVDDFDGDNDLDVLASTWHTRGQLRLFGNNGNGTFTERTAAAGLAGLFGGLNLVQADYDNDGDLDFLVLRGAWWFETGRHPNSLVRNNGDGTFTDVTFAAGLAEVHYPTQTAAWADYDNDGDLDLYIGNESSQRARFPSQLFENRGDGTFGDVARRAGVTHDGFAKGVTWGDYDGDCLPDLYVSNSGQPNRLYHNQGDGTFVDAAVRVGVDGPRLGFPTWFWDFDNDGALDLFASSYATGIGHLAAYHLGRPLPAELAKLYRGDGRGGFRDVAREVGLDYPSLPMGANFGDLDGDGWLDFHLGTGNVHDYSLMPNLMFKNRGGDRFVDITMAAGFGHLQKGHGIAFADLDHDGDLDVFGQMGGAYPGDGFHDALYENPGFGHRWLTIKLVGTRSNRSAIGARIRVDVVEDSDGGAPRSIYRHVGSGASFGSNPLRQTIGLGRARTISRVDVFWPTTGETQVVEDVALDSAITVVEGEAGYTVLDLPKTRLGGG